jgi:hypothetical protein
LEPSKAKSAGGSSMEITWEACCCTGSVLLHGKCVIAWEVCYSMGSVLLHGKRVIAWGVCYHMGCVL